MTTDLSPEKWAAKLAVGDVNGLWTYEHRVNVHARILTAHHNAVVEACARRMCFGCELDWPVEMLDHLRCHVAPTTMKHACKAQAILALKVGEEK